jgi:hypothetical protein
MSDTPSSRWADSDAAVDPDSVLWKQYMVYVDLFKLYVDSAWRRAFGFTPSRVFYCPSTLTI